MRITHVYKAAVPTVGGIEHHLHTLARRQVARGHQVTVLVPGPTRATDMIAGVRIERIPAWFEWLSTPVAPGLPFALARTRPHLIHLHLPYPPGEIATWLSHQNTPYVVTYHSDVVRPAQRAIRALYRPLLTRILHHASAVITTSPGLARTSPILAPLRDRVHIVPLGIDPAPYLPIDINRPAQSHPTVLFVGRSRYYKGLPVLLRALTQLPNVHLHVVGDGPCRARWQRHAHQLQLAGRVTFFGHVPAADLPAHFAAADLLVLPSTHRAEAFGAVLLEAMAAGLPTVATDHGLGASVAVQHGHTGLLVPPGDATALAAAIQCLIDRPALRRTMGRNGRQRLLAHFTAHHLERRTAAVYAAALSQPAAIPTDLLPEVNT